MKKEIWVYDIETYPNIFTFVFRSIGGEKIVFELSKRKWELDELIEFLQTRVSCLVGYNNLAFDYPILHFILTKKNITLERLYKEVQRVINSQFAAIKPWNVLIPQVDLLKINHYDNKARRCSLKWLEFTMRWGKLQDLPFKPGTIIPENQFDFLIEYNCNDVDFTFQFMTECFNAIIFRQEMSKYLKSNVMNYSDVRIGELINRQNYSKMSGIPYQDFKDLRTHREVFVVKELVPAFISYETKVLQDFYASIIDKTFTLDEEFYRYITLGDLSMKFAKGGLHSADTPKVFKCKEGWYLKEKDVGSMYPKAIIAGGFYPAHLGPTWNQGINLLYEERLNELKPAMKKLDRKSKEYKFLDSKQGAYKLAMNGGGYGKTGDQFNWQYDPKVTMQVTLRGQLSLIMLIEKYHLLGCEVISANTDGIVIHYPKELDPEVERIHKEWEDMTDSILEDTFYSQIVFRDVNNYIAAITDEDGNSIKNKFKGCFELDQDYHKNNSQRIVAIALMEYFINGVPVKDVICNQGYKFVNSKGKDEVTSIYDYCKGVKKVKGQHGYAFVKPNQREVIEDKVIRFYISTNGSKMYKLYDPEFNRVESVAKGFLATPFMNYQEKDDYNIDYNYYINECNKIIEPIERGTRTLGSVKPEQLTLF